MLEQERRQVAFYVCDRCGHLWRQPPEPGDCRRCGHTALWEFPEPEAARMHAQTVKTRKEGSHA